MGTGDGKEGEFQDEAGMRGGWRFNRGNNSGELKKAGEGWR